MENIKGFFDSFKEFIWDIIGYLLPGAFLIILVTIFTADKYFVLAESDGHLGEFYPYIIIAISYILGHAIYGLGSVKERIMGKYSYTKKIEAQIAQRQSFEYSKELLAEALQQKGVTNKLNIASVRDVRNLAMSFVPESDQKIYTFTFRADLSNHVGNVSITLGIIGLICSITKYITNIDIIFKTDFKFILIYICLIISYLLFRETRNRFYAISIGLPFSIYTANSIKS